MTGMWWGRGSMDVDWNFDMTTALRDGTLLQLLVQSEHEDGQSGFDDNDPTRSMGFNNFDNDNEDVWKFPGWSWSHDFITEQGRGKPIAWALMLPIPPHLINNP